MAEEKRAASVELRVRCMTNVLPSFFLCILGPATETQDPAIEAMPTPSPEEARNGSLQSAANWSSLSPHFTPASNDSTMESFSADFPNDMNAFDIFNTSVPDQFGNQFLSGSPASIFQRGLSPLFLEPQATSTATVQHGEYEFTDPNQRGIQLPGGAEAVSQPRNQNTQASHSAFPEGNGLSYPRDAFLSEKPSSLDFTQDCMKQLSDMNAALFRLDQACNAEKWANMFETPSSFIPILTTAGDLAACQPNRYPVVELFEKTQGFLDLVKHFFSPTNGASLPSEAAFDATDSLRLRSQLHFNSQPPSQGPMSYARETPRRYSMSSASSTDSDSTTTSRHGSEGPGFGFSRKPDFFMSTPASSAGPPTPPPKPTSLVQPDLAISLMLATCYVRINHLYTTLFRHILHFTLALQTVAAAGRPDRRSELPPQIPSLDIGGFKPPSYGTLQIMLVVQTSCHLLAQIERVSGIEEWERNENSSEPSAPAGTSAQGQWRDRSARRGAGERQDYRSPNKSRSRQRSEGQRESQKHVFPELFSPELIRVVTRAQDCEGKGAGDLVALRRTVRKVKRLLKKMMAL